MKILFQETDFLFEMIRGREARSTGAQSGDFAVTGLPCPFPDSSHTDAAVSASGFFQGFHKTQSSKIFKLCQRAGFSRTKEKVTTDSL